MVSDCISADCTGILMTAIGPAEPDLILCSTSHLVPTYHTGCEHRIIIVPAHEAGISGFGKSSFGICDGQSADHEYSN